MFKSFSIEELDREIFDGTAEMLKCLGEAKDSKKGTFVYKKWGKELKTAKFSYASPWGDEAKEIAEDIKLQYQ